MHAAVPRQPYNQPEQGLTRPLANCLPVVCAGGALLQRIDAPPQLPPPLLAMLCAGRHGPLAQAVLLWFTAAVMQGSGFRFSCGTPLQLPLRLSARGPPGGAGERWNGCIRGRRYLEGYQRIEGYVASFIEHIRASSRMPRLLCHCQWLRRLLGPSSDSAAAARLFFHF